MLKFQNNILSNMQYAAYFFRKGQNSKSQKLNLRSSLHYTEMDAIVSTEDRMSATVITMSLKAIVKAGAQL